MVRFQNRSSEINTLYKFKHYSETKRNWHQTSMEQEWCCCHRGVLSEPFKGIAYVISPTDRNNSMRNLMSYYPFIGTRIDSIQGFDLNQPSSSPIRTVRRDRAYCSTAPQSFEIHLNPKLINSTSSTLGTFIQLRLHPENGRNLYSVHIHCKHFGMRKN